MMMAACSKMSLEHKYYLFSLELKNHFLINLKIYFNRILQSPYFL